MDNKEQRAKYMRDWRLNNPNFADYQKQYNEKYLSDPANKEAARKRARDYYNANKEHVKSLAKARYHATKNLKGRPTGEKNPNWKGDGVGYAGLHKWISKERGRPCKCEHCGVEDLAHPKRFQWANKSHEYKRELDDWIRLCAKCHWAYDQKERPRGERGKLI